MARTRRPEGSLRPTPARDIQASSLKDPTPDAAEHVHGDVPAAAFSESGGSEPPPATLPIVKDSGGDRPQLDDQH